MANRYVVATRPFQYTPDLKVSRGQVFPLAGAVNDPLLLKHGHVVDYTGTVASVKDLPKCGECGAQFEEEYLRDLHAELHEMTAEERRRRRRAKTHRTYRERVMQVGM